MLQSIRPRKYQHTEFNFLELQLFQVGKLLAIYLLNVLLHVRITTCILVPWTI